MNRRELLAAGIGLGALAISSPTSFGADDKGQVAAAGDVYCPMYPYMFCGNYTLYYAVQNVSGNCGANPTSLAGPNGLALGCGGTGCQVTLVNDVKAPVARTAIPINNHQVDKDLKRNGTGTMPHSVATIQGVSIVKKLLNVKNAGGQNLFYARVYDVTIIPGQLDKAELLTMITQADIDRFPTTPLSFFPGHESGASTTGETTVDAKVIRGTGNMDHSTVVELTAGPQIGQQYLIIKR